MEIGSKVRLINDEWLVRRTCEVMPFLGWKEKISDAIGRSGRVIDSLRVEDSLIFKVRFRCGSFWFPKSLLSETAKRSMNESQRDASVASTSQLLLTSSFPSASASPAPTPESRMGLLRTARDLAWPDPANPQGHEWKRAASEMSMTTSSNQDRVSLHLSESSLEVMFFDEEGKEPENLAWDENADEKSQITAPTLATLGLLLKPRPAGFFYIEKVLQTFGDGAIIPGDVLCAVGGESTSGMTQPEVSTRLIGVLGSRTTVDIARLAPGAGVVRHEVAFLYTGNDHLFGLDFGSAAPSEPSPMKVFSSGPTPVEKFSIDQAAGVGTLETTAQREEIGRDVTERGTDKITPQEPIVVGPPIEYEVNTKYNHAGNIHGATLTAAHPLRTLLWALKEGVVRSKLRRDRNPTADLMEKDFQNHISEELGEETASIKFTEFAPRVFSRLSVESGREDGERERERPTLLQACTAADLRLVTPSGNKNNILITTDNCLFSFRSVSSSSFFATVSVLKKYYERLKSSPSSLLPRLIGMYEIKNAAAKTYILATANPLCFSLELQSLYFLKGSASRLVALKPKATSEMIGRKSVQDDTHFLYCNESIFLNEIQRKKLFETVREDVQILADAGLTDYQLALGIARGAHHSERASLTPQNIFQGWNRGSPSTFVLSLTEVWSPSGLASATLSSILQSSRRVSPTEYAARLVKFLDKVVVSTNL